MMSRMEYRDTKIIIFLVIVLVAVLALSYINSLESTREDSIALEVESAPYYEGVFDTCMAFSIKLKLSPPKDIMSRCEELALDAVERDLGGTAAEKGRLERWMPAQPGSSA